ncbi:tRNA pseudouridine(38-40) synthase TruA [Roseivirga pacifica]|uniref:tRNA pseudouridine(38-40) synthase TruA n=1 Tax=Roseivirga pacifica TaxID=1267423 RepID=UPI003BABCBAD
MRYFLDISYNGTNYHGWQIQPNAHTVQAEIQSALSKMLRAETAIVGSGRTDTGVHAKKQVAHFDVVQSWEPSQLTYKLNAILPNDVVINKVHLVKGDAHARFDAVERGYEYFLRMERSPFGLQESLYVPYKLDVELMNHAASKLIGKQDFESFSRVKTEVNNFICDLRKAEFIWRGDLLVFEVKADRFLRGMIRALVGTLIDVGRGKLTPEDFVNIINAKDRKAAGKAAAPHGLFLTQVDYPEDIYLDFGEGKR